MEKLIIFQKTFDCYKYLYVALRQFPKSERHVLAADIKNVMNEFLQILITANKSQNKIKFIHEADVKLDMLRIHVRLGKELQFLKIKQYEILSNQLSEIGRLLGGWLKSSNGAKFVSVSRFAAATGTTVRMPECSR
jgi:hypothetical protein